MDNPTQSDESNEERAKRWEETDKRIASPASRAESVWRTIISHGDECTEWKRFLEETEDYNLTCFCIMYLSYQAQGNLTFMSEEVKKAATLLHVFHYDFYAPNKDKNRHETIKATDNDSEADEGSRPELRVIK